MYIGLSKLPSRDAVEQAFARHVPGARLWWGSLTDAEFDGDFALTIDPNASEFSSMLNVWVLSGQDGYALGLRIARELSVALDCSTICDGSLHGTDRSPYWSIVWQRGIPFLADDCDTLFADGAGDISPEERQKLGPVRLVSPLTIKF